MMEKICTHCGATLLVGLQYCPGCLRAIDGRVESKIVEVPEPEGKLGANSVLTDLQVSWANLIYPLKSSIAERRGRPQPKEPPTIEARKGLGESFFASREPQLKASLSLSLGYTRVVCPKCHGIQRASLDLSPSAMVTCNNCSHPFPGSFAVEFRKGADLQCYRCGVTTFCVSGHNVTTCPNCRYGSKKSSKRLGINPAAIILLGALLFFGFFFAVATKTTPQFLVWMCVTIIGSAVGFVTLAALGF